MFDRTRRRRVLQPVDAPIRTRRQHVPGGCAFPWQQAEGEFIDPCWGSHYTLSGDCVDGPCKRGLDRFAIERRLDGNLLVRIDRFGQGALRGEQK